MAEKTRKRSSKWDLEPEEQTLPTIHDENVSQLATRRENVSSTSKTSSNSSRDDDEQNLKDRINRSNPRRRSRSRSRSRERDRNKDYRKKRSRSRSPARSMKRNDEGEDRRQTEERHGETSAHSWSSLKPKSTHESYDGILGQPPQHLVDGKYLGFNRDGPPSSLHQTDIDRNGSSIRESDYIVINTQGSMAEEREKQSKFVMPFPRPLGSIPLNGPSQFSISPRPPPLHGFHGAETLKPESQIQVPFQNSPLYNRQTLQIPLYHPGQGQLVQPLTPQAIKSSNSLIKGHPQIPLLQGVNPRPEPPKMEALKSSDNNKAASLPSLTASLSHIFGNGHQLPQLYAALNPQHGSGLLGRPLSLSQHGSGGLSDSAASGPQLLSAHAALNPIHGPGIVGSTYSGTLQQSMHAALNPRHGSGGFVSGAASGQSPQPGFGHVTGAFPGLPPQLGHAAQNFPPASGLLVGAVSGPLQQSARANVNPLRGSGALTDAAVSRQPPPAADPPIGLDHGKGDEHQLKQLYASLNPQQTPGLVGGLTSGLPPQPVPPKNVAAPVKEEISRMSPGLPLNSSEQKTEAIGNGEQEEKKTEAAKETKDTKALKAFKCALVEFVKEVLRPTWKEGQMSKDAHKTIVKKTVEKVITTLEGNIPHTKGRIDLYMSYSKDKLTKLVQAYREKYMKT